jgi:hypothetical protein
MAATGRKPRDHGFPNWRTMFPIRGVSPLALADIAQFARLAGISRNALVCEILEAWSRDLRLVDRFDGEEGMDE